VQIVVGDDWAEDHHDVHLMDVDGKKLGARRLPEGLDGIRMFHELTAAHIDDPAEVIIGIETDRGLWVTALVAAGYQVYAINPLAASRYRDRHSVAGAKSDPGDAKMLADLVRTDRHNHRQVAGDTSEAEAIRIMARGHQNLIWTRTRQTNAWRNSLLEYYPAALAAFDDLAHTDCLSVLANPHPNGGNETHDRADRSSVTPRWPATKHQPTRHRNPNSVPGSRAPRSTTVGRGRVRCNHHRDSRDHHRNEPPDHPTRNDAGHVFCAAPGRRHLPLPARIRCRTRRPGTRRIRGRPQPLRQP
jgi:Transposase